MLSSCGGASASRDAAATKNRPSFVDRHWTCVSTAAGVCVLVCCCEGVRIAEVVVWLVVVARDAARHRARARTSRLRMEKRLIAFATRTVAVFARFSRYNAPSVTSGTDETLGCGVKGVWTPNAQRAWSELDIIVVFLARGRPVHCPSYSSLCFGIGV